MPVPKGNRVSKVRGQSCDSSPPCLSDEEDPSFHTALSTSPRGRSHPAPPLISMGIPWAELGESGGRRPGQLSHDGARTGTVEELSLFEAKPHFFR